MQVAVIHTAFEETSNTVAFVEVGNLDVIGVEQALEYAYFRTQNLQGSWSKGPTITWKGEKYPNGDYHKDVTVMASLSQNEYGEDIGLRSTSVGDHILVGTTKYVVDMVGFKELETA